MLNLLHLENFLIENSNISEKFILLTFDCLKKIISRSKAKKSKTLLNDIITIDDIIFKSHNILIKY